MSEITEKKYLSYEGLTLYDSGIKEYVKGKPSLNRAHSQSE